MPLKAGDATATQGLARDIYVVLDQQLRPPLEASLDEPEEQLPPLQEAWKMLSFCIAAGVIEHLTREPPSEPDYAEAFTSSAQDSAYWGWLAGFAKVFRDWAASAGTIADLRTSLTTFFNANATPTQLRGILR